MRSKSVQKRTMQNSAHILGLARSAAATLVEREQRKTGSRMTAYEAIAASIGTSSSWVRKFVGRSPDVKPDLVIGLNILSLYNTLCTRVEQEAEIERAKCHALRDEIHEATQGALELVDRKMRAPPAGKDEG